MPFPFPFTLFGSSRASAGDDDCFTYCYGGDWVQGKVGNYGLTFGSPTTTSIEVPTASDIDFTTQEFSVACWVSSSTSAGRLQGFINKATSAGFVHDGWIIGRNYEPGSGLGTTNEFLFSTRNDSLSPDFDYTFTDSTYDDDWHHILAVRDGTSNRLYVDGVTAATTVSTMASLGSTSDNLRIGQWWTHTSAGNDYGLSGKIDEVAIWDVALTESDASALYNSGNGARADSITPPAASDGPWTTGVSGSGGLEFEGSMQMEEVTFGGVVSAASLAMQPNAGTMAAWIKAESNSANPGAVVFGAYRSTPGGTNADYGGALFHSYGGAGRLMFNLGNDTSYAYEITTGALVLDTWYHVALSWESTFVDAGDFKCYVNGAPAEDFKGAGVTRANGASFDPSDDKTNRKFVMGGYYDTGTDLWFDGTISDFACWDVILDSDAIASLTGTQPSSVSSSNLVSYYDMKDGGGSSTLTDRSENGYNGTLEGYGDVGTGGKLLLYYDFEIGDSNPVSGNFPMSDTIYDVDTVSWKSSTMHTGTMTTMSDASFGDWTQGKIGKYAINIDGNAEYIETANNALLNFADKTSTFSAAGWVKTSDTSGFAYIWGKVDQGGDQPGWWTGYDASGHMDQYVYFRINDGVVGTGKRMYGTATSNIANGNWHHLAFVKGSGYSAVTDMKIYVDGVDKTLADNSSGLPLGYGPSSSAGLRLGDLDVVPGSYEWDGEFDDFAVWNVALDSGAISDLYNSGVGAKANTVSSSAIVTYLDMECNGPGTTIAKDQTSNEISGTLNGMDPGTCGAG